MGKKYVIELEDSPFVGTWKSSDGKTLYKVDSELYRVRGFKSLVFDRDGIKRLTPLEDVLKAYEKSSNNVEVGDEVRVDNIRFIVTHVAEDGGISGIDINGVSYFYMMDEENSNGIYKTGRKFPKLVYEIGKLEELSKLDLDW